MRTTPEQRQEIAAKLERLAEMKRWLKSQFFAIDDVIDRVADSIEPLLLFPKASQRPHVVNLWGMTGCGKTDLVRKIAEFLDFGNKFLYYDVGNNDVRMSSIFGGIDDGLHYLDGQSVVICFDEFQHMRTLNEDRHETFRQEYRLVWEILDTGRIEYTENFGYSFKQDVKTILKIMEIALAQGVSVKKGMVKSKAKKYWQMLLDNDKKFNLGCCIYSEEDDMKAGRMYFLPEKYRIWIFETIGKDFEDHLDFENYITSLDGPETIRLMSESLRIANSKKILDLSKSLIFVVGNLDEAYEMSKDLNPDNDPDVLRKYSRRIGLHDIKQQLGKRFRPEQIARLGNNHIIYPSLSSQGFRDIINAHLREFAARSLDEYNIEIEFDRSVTDIIYNDGVFPTQGARPVMTTARMLIDTNFTKIMGEILKTEKDIEKIIWRFEDGEFRIALLSGGELIDTIRIAPSLQIESRRQPKKDNKQAVIAVHESGHAIVGYLRTGIMPKQIKAVTADSNTGGMCLGDEIFPYLTRRFLMDKIETLLGGYIAEKLIFGEENISIGSEADLDNARNIAWAMIYKYGFGPHRMKLDSDMFESEGQVMSEAESREAMYEIVKRCESRAGLLLTENRDLLIRLSWHLAEHATIESDQLRVFFMKYSSDEKASLGESADVEAYMPHRRMLESLAAERTLPKNGKSPTPAHLK
ncbi:MAG: hypothetical protein ACLFQX_07445 [Candidatus Kapaibacterium sp.]